MSDHPHAHNQARVCEGSKPSLLPTTAPPSIVMKPYTQMRGLLDRTESLTVESPVSSHSCSSYYSHSIIYFLHSSAKFLLQDYFSMGKISYLKLPLAHCFIGTTKSKCSETGLLFGEPLSIQNRRLFSSLRHLEMGEMS